jgi:hypothetical protein
VGVYGTIAYSDKKVVGVFVRFRAPLVLIRNAAVDLSKLMWDCGLERAGSCSWLAQLKSWVSATQVFHGKAAAVVASG